MYLLDTNIWLERLLNQNKAGEVRQFLDSVASSELALSDFSFHSICIVLGKNRELALLDQFVTDLFVDGQTVLASLSGSDVPQVTAAMRSQKLDFDDAYQYVLSNRDRLTLISFDTDFDQTDLARLTPAQALATLSLKPPDDEI